MWLQVQGRKAYVYTGGRPFEATRPALVFLHGAQHDHSVWALQSRYLAHHGYGVLAVDFPGHGRSAGPALPDIEAMAGWVLEAMTAAEVGRATLIGHSMGSLVSLEAAGQAPDRIERIALLGPAFPMKVSDVLLNAARDDEPAAFDMINVWSHSDINHSPGYPGPGFSVFVGNRRLMERQAPGVLLNDLAACNRYAAGFDRARAVRCPVAFVIGQRDQMAPPRATRELIKQLGEKVVSITEIPQCGHAMMTEKPDEVLHALRSFLTMKEAQPQ